MSLWFKSMEEYLGRQVLHLGPEELAKSSGRAKGFQVRRTTLQGCWTSELYRKTSPVTQNWRSAAASAKKLKSAAETAWGKGRGWKTKRLFHQAFLSLGMGASSLLCLQDAKGDLKNFTWKGLASTLASKPSLDSDWIVEELDKEATIHEQTDAAEAMAGWRAFAKASEL